MTDRDLIVVSWDGNNINDTTNYESGFVPAHEWGLPAVKAQLVKRDGAWPKLGAINRPGRKLNLIVRITGANKRSLRDQLLRWFDPEDGTAKQLVVEDEDGTNDRYVEAICESCTPVMVGGLAHRDSFLVQLAVDGDVRWRDSTESSDTWNITASGQTNVIDNTGSDDAYPILEITPTSSRTGALDYHQFIPIVWLSANRPAWGEGYPVRLGPMDTRPASSNVEQTDGDDIWVYVDGVAVDRWLVDVNTANTYIWINLTFAPAVSATLGEAIAASGSIDSIAVGEDVYEFPESGLVFIDDEVFAYTGRDLAEEKLTGITRAAKGSSMAAHTTSDTVYWLQHEVYIAYGNATIDGPDVDDDYQPSFSTAAADSSNTQWLYNNFGGAPGKQAGRWGLTGAVTGSGKGGLYTATQHDYAYATFSVMGTWISELHGDAYAWWLYNPCGIVNADWASGSRRIQSADGGSLSNFVASLRHWPRDGKWWQTLADISAPSSLDAWEAWSEAAGAAFDTSDYILMGLWFHPSEVEVSTVTVTLDSTETPVVDMTACAEQGNYQLQATLSSDVHDDTLEINFDMELNETLTIDTYEETVIYEKDGSSQFQAITLNSVRDRWFKMTPGNNTWTFTNVNTGNVTIVTKWRDRYY